MHSKIGLITAFLSDYQLIYHEKQRLSTGYLEIH